MEALSRIRALVRNLFHPAARERELDEELRAYVDMAVQARVAAGMGEVEARRAVAVEMGRVDTVKEEVRAVRAGAGLDSVGRDLALAVRQLRRARAFAAAVVATLALAIGANAAVFSVIQAVLLAPPAYREPDRLMVLWSNLDLAGYKRAPLSGPELLDLRQQARSFEDIAAIWTTTAQISGEGEPEQLRVGLVTANFFSLLGVEPRLGRNFEPTGALTAMSGRVGDVACSSCVLSPLTTGSFCPAVAGLSRSGSVIGWRVRLSASASSSRNASMGV